MDWIKVDKDTPEKWQISNIIDDCHCSQGDAFLAFFKLFRWLDSQTADGFVPMQTPAKIDRLVGLKGFAESLARSGWLTFTDAGLLVSNYGEHNGQCAKARAQNAARMNAVRKAKSLAAKSSSAPIAPRR